MHIDHRLETPLFLFLYFLIFAGFTVAGDFQTINESFAGEGPSTAKAFLIRYWNKKIQNNSEKPSFLLSKSSPLTAADTINFAKLAIENTLSTHLLEFCTSANLLCRNDQLQILEQPQQRKFQRYFVNYGYSQANSTNKEVELGLFFRESLLKTGTVMPMPDIKDQFMRRSFLPRSILSKLPFSNSKLGKLREIFQVKENSSIANIMESALRECERAPAPGEIKQCVGSAEDMIDFATSVIGQNIVVRTADSSKGSKQNVFIGKVTVLNGGKLIRSVSCHQMLYPYLLYYCHSIPNVQVYESDILDQNSKTNINHVVAICHKDTSSWSPTYYAFLLLGPGPGKFEVCHWIFENSMVWTTAD